MLDTYFRASLVLLVVGLYLRFLFPRPIFRDTASEGGHRRADIAHDVGNCIIRIILFIYASYFIVVGI
ncbi:hypothetical protein VP150E351_P0118 [Vibrio phage 150E35-1]|nr:hypothetical protein VP150E351_P0118 [Vibrio phage 150E35-1]